MHRTTHSLKIVGLGLCIGLGFVSSAVAQPSCLQPDAGWILCEDFESGAFDNPPWRDRNLISGSSLLQVQSSVVAGGVSSAESRSLPGSPGSLWASRGFADHPLWPEGTAVEDIYLYVQIRFADLSAAERLINMHCFEDWSAGYGEPNNWSPYFMSLQFRNAAQATQPRELEGVVYRKTGATTTTRSLLPNLATVQLQTGLWYEVEYHMSLNTPGANNGVFEVWIDGTKIIEYRDVDYRGTYDQLGWNHLMIGTSVGHSPAQSIFYDNVILSEERIGSDGSGEPDGGVDGGVGSDGGAGEYCGNGITEPGEDCDDGNASNQDGCLNRCRAASCGDGIVYRGREECDDGNTFAGDGCDEQCVRSTSSTPRANASSSDSGCSLGHRAEWPGFLTLLLCLGALRISCRRSTKE